MDREKVTKALTELHKLYNSDISLKFGLGVAIEYLQSINRYSEGLPEKKEIDKDANIVKEACYGENQYEYGYNLAIDDCSLAIPAIVQKEIERRASEGIILQAIERIMPCKSPYDQCLCPEWKPDLARVIHDQLVKGE